MNAPQQAERPLCVDLDGTLLRTDTLLESLLAVVKKQPLTALLLPWWLARGRAHLKRQIAARAELDSAGLPYNLELLAYLRAEHAAGRALVLVSAADESIVRPIAAHLGIFCDVLASDGAVNLKGERKMAALRARYGSGGYDYAGNDRSDIRVWSDARAAIVVNASDRVVNRITVPVTRTFARPRRRLRSLAKALRVQQWVKNVLLFVALLMAPEARNLALFWDAFVAFVAFSLCASAVYVANDMLDLAADRRHATKRQRPFASGDLPLAFGFVLGPVCMATGIGLSLLLPRAFLGILLVYMTVTTAYSFRLKHVPLVDVLVLAMLYTGRVIAGAAATRVWPSPWLLGFSLFFFLSLAFVKRYSELYALRQQQESLKVRGYYPADLELVATNGAVSGYLSVLVAALYINSDRVVGLYSEPALLWLICPLLLYWISRVWLLAHHGEMHDDPVLFAIRDRASYVVGALLALILLLARFVGPLH